MRIPRFLFWALIALVIVVITALVVLIIAKAVYLLLGVGFSQAWQRFVSIPLPAIGALAVLTGALVALLVWLWNIRRQYSEDLLKESQSFFAKAFETLNVLDEDGWPLHDRIRWLTSARLLKVAQQMGRKIEVESHKLIYEEIKEYWRGKFSDIVQPREGGFPEFYFAEQPEHFLSYSSRDREPLALFSIRAIYRFVRWTEGRSDLLDNEPPFSEEELRQMEVIGPRNLARLMRRYNECLRDRGLL